MNAKRLLCLAACLGLSVSAAAQDTAPPTDPLRGPAVSDHAKRTLVRFNMSGRFEPIEGRPEAAAALLLDLDEPTAARVREIIDQRDVAVAMLLVEEIDLVGEISDAVVAGDSETARAKLVRLWEGFEPDHPRTPLLEPLGTALDAQQLAEVVRLTEEYWDALISQTVGQGPDDRPKPTPEVERQTAERLAFQMFQTDVRVGYEATLRRYRDAMEGIYNAVEPTEEQRREMRAILLDHIRTTQLRATPEQRRTATRRMYDLLDDERRGMFFDYLLRQIVPDNQ